MSAKPENLPASESLNETIDFLGQGMAGPRHQPNPTEGRHRYTFGSGARPLEGYTIKRAIGRGGFGEVYYATSDSGKEVALKLITRNLEIERRGVAQCMNLKCPNLLAIHDIKGNDDGDTFVIMEYVAGPNLAQVLAEHPNGMPIPDVRAWLRGLVEGVSYLHDHGIVHRDLKPANLFMEEGVVKIGDYGLSKMITSERVSNHSESIGTCHYMAPEISTGKYNKPIDVYAIGVILFEMIVGVVPFEGETVGEVLIKHLTTRPDLSRLPEPFRGIVAQTLAKDPMHRQPRVLDLLPRDDAPVIQDVRYIGDGKAPSPAPTPRGVAPLGGSPKAKPSPKPAPASRPADDGIFRITDEEPVLYIGPDTQPPPSANRRRPWRNARREARREARLEKVVQAARRVRLVASAPLPPSEPILPPAPLPSGRVLVAELAGSLFAAALWSALATAIGGAALQVDLARRPQDVGFLYAMITLASWAALVGGKLTEGRNLSTKARRGGQLALGALVGVLAQVMVVWFLVEPPPANHSVVRFLGFEVDYLPALTPSVLGYATYFALVGFGVDWWLLTDRDRRRRFRILPVLKSGLIALIPALIFFSVDRHPLVIPTVLLTSVVVQLSAPWNEAAARYLWATRFNRRWVA